MFKRGMLGGFTLIEVVLVALIVALLAAVVMPRMHETAREAQYKACYANVSNINSQIELFHVINQAWPVPANPGTAVKDTDLGGDENYFPDGVPACPVTDDEYMLNAITHRIIGHNENTTEAHSPPSP